MPTLVDLEAALASLRGVVHLVKPLPPSSSLEPRPSSAFFLDLELVERYSRCNEVTLQQVKLATFNVEQDVEASLLDRVVKCLEIVVKKNKNLVDKDLTGIVDWTKELEQKVIVSLGGLGGLGGLGDSEDLGVSGSISKVTDDFDSSFNKSANSFSVDNSIESDNLSSDTSGFFSSGYSLEKGEEEGEDLDLNQVMDKGKKRVYEEDSDEAQEEEVDREDDEREFRLAKRRMMKGKEKEKEQDLEGEEGEDGVSRHGEEIDENDLEDDQSSSVDAGWCVDAKYYIFLGSRSMKVLRAALPTIDSYLDARRNHNPPLPDSLPLTNTPPFVQLYDQWHIVKDDSKIDSLGEAWIDLVELADEEKVDRKDLFYGVSQIAADVKSGNLIDLDKLQDYVAHQRTEHARQAFGRRLQAVDPVLEPVYQKLKPDAQTKALISSGLQYFFNSNSIHVGIRKGTLENSLCLSRKVGLLGTTLLVEFGFKNRFDDDDEIQLNKLLAAIKKNKKKSGGRKAKGRNTGAQVKGWIRLVDHDYLLETEIDDKNYSISITTSIKDHVNKKIAPVFSEMRGLFSRLGDIGLWYAVKESQGWTLERFDTHQSETSKRTFICEVGGEGEEDSDDD